MFQRAESSYEAIQEGISTVERYLPELNGLDEERSDVEWDFYEVPESHQPVNEFQEINEEADKEKNSLRKYGAAALSTNIGLGGIALQYGGNLGGPEDVIAAAALATPYALSGCAALELLLEKPGKLDEKADERKPYDQLPDEYEPEEVVAVPKTDLREAYKTDNKDTVDTPLTDKREIEESSEFDLIEPEKEL